MSLVSEDKAVTRMSEVLIDREPARAPVWSARFSAVVAMLVPLRRTVRFKPERALRHA